MLEPVWHKQLKRIVYMKEPEEILVTKIANETAEELKTQANEFKAAHVVMTPEQIYDYMHEEHTPYVSMTAEEGKLHIIELIRRWSEFNLNIYKQGINDIRKQNIEENKEIL